MRCIGGFELIHTHQIDGDNSCDRILTVSHIFNISLQGFYRPYICGYNIEWADELLIVRVRTSKLQWLDSSILLDIFLLFNAYANEYYEAVIYTIASKLNHANVCFWQTKTFTLYERMMEKDLCSQYITYNVLLEKWSLCFTTGYDCQQHAKFTIFSLNSVCYSLICITMS